ncbi:hypothetical protein PHYBOEH_011008 [Phytophthora boehmeriae]|uniref:PHD-type domain-containing protein n=1 Tax=Phytophthora boehmeriae TaxID=109152 RepID=A0A8T1XDD7_9STRA|nr:hypothetical protein PHYBOEH_011008 [Phytophthora boehmeriae]
MSRRGASTAGDTGGGQSPRERSNSNSSTGTSTGAATTSSPQFATLHSRVGWRYQATIPELLTSAGDADEILYKRQALQNPRPRFIPDRAEDLGPELEKYLKLARSLRDGATFDTQEQVETLALQHLHRFDYNTTDAACSLYARHSIELPTSAGEHQAKTTSAEEAKKWLLAFYRCMRCRRIDVQVLEQMCVLQEKAQTRVDVIPPTEASVLGRLVSRIVKWREQCEAVKKDKVERARLLQLLHQAEDMQVVLPEKEEIAYRIHSFDNALTQLKEALERGSKRHQNRKVCLQELDALFEAVIAPRVIFAEEDSIHATVDEAKNLKHTIEKMVADEKVSLPVMRDVLAKIELVPVNFEQEVDQFQKKMLNAQTWLAKARKCMPNRRATRRAGGADTKKMDLKAIRALVEDAPCENSTEMFEMQDLLDCADEWASKVKEAIEGGADVQLDRLKELLDEAKDIPVVMDEQKYLEAEISAREWCTTAALKLASRKSIEEMEKLLSEAREIRERIHPKKQSRWKPQIERDINAAMDQARKWVNELRDHLGFTAFDKMFASLASYFPSSHSRSSTSNSKAKKKSMDAISKLIEKSQALAIDVSSYTVPLNELLLKGVEAQAEASAILMSIGCLSGTISLEPVEDTNTTNYTDIESMMSSQPVPQEPGDLGQASALLERIDAFPFTFEEGLALTYIVEREKSWAARVRECIPPRQSRKKRQANDPFTTEQLHDLLNQSKKLRFLFSEELRILAKELNDLIVWRAKAHEVIDGEVSASIATVAKRLQSFDLLVYEKLQKAKKKLHIGDEVITTGDNKSGEDMNMDTSEVHERIQPCIKQDEKSDGCSMDVDAEGPSNTDTPVHCNKQERSDAEVTVIDGKTVSTKSEAQETVFEDTKPFQTPPIQVLEIQADSIMTHVRMESGCTLKADTSDDDDSNSENTKATWMSKHGETLLEPVLAMLEESLVAVDGLELKEAEARQTVEELVLAGEEGGITGNITDESVRALEAWKEQLVHVQEESDLLSVVSPEQKALSLIISLLEWLQSSRSIFYDETLPLHNLVAKGSSIADELETMKLHPVVKPETLETLEQMLWPLPHLKTHEKVMLDWTERVHKCIADKHARVDELQTLLNSGSGLLLEQNAFKIVLDEAKKARLWLSKLKKRLKGLVSKGVGRLSMSAARSLVEEGEDLAIDIPVFDFLKEHLETASDWETRVLASGIETGQARVANLLGLLDEYECARLVIDLDMHRDVLKSATERYCICRQPFDGLMIGCDHCDDWFHDSCIGMSKEKAEKVEHYTCPSCTILRELQAMLHQGKTEGQQKNLWDMQEYAKAFEKQHASALRKIKREEKNIERTEMQLYSCNNQMNQLRARIEEAERARVCLAINPMAGKGTLGQQKASNLQMPRLPTPPTSQQAAIPSSSKTNSVQSTVQTASMKSGVAPVGTNALLLAAAAASATAAAVASTSSSSITAPTMSTGMAAASALAGMNETALKRQQYPNILLPSVQLANSVFKSAQTKPSETVAKGPTTGSKSANSLVSAKSGAVASGALPSASKTVVPTVSSTALTVPSAAHATPHQRPTSSAVASVPTPVSASGGQKIPSPSMLNSVTATLMGPTERLAALVVAGGVEQQLSKMKGEHVEASKKVQEHQDTLRLSRVRLANAQQALRDLTEVFHARHRMLPYAQAWVRQAVSLLNTTALLSRVNLDSSTFLPPEYATALTEVTRPAPAPTTSSTPASSASTSIEKLFPGVNIYARLLRAVSWSQVVASLLQERPSRSEISDAIAYATQYELWDDKKTLTPLRSLIGRVDAWVSRAHKCMTKTTNKTQQLSRLKLLMNEYSKLPLTCSQASEPLDICVKRMSNDGGLNKTKNENGELTLETAEFAATKALEEAMSRVSTSTSTPSASGIVSAAKSKQLPRKRKAYTRKDKAPLKKPKKLQGPSSGLGKAVPAVVSPITSTTSVVPNGGAAPPSSPPRST